MNSRYATAQINQMFDHAQKIIRTTLNAEDFVSYQKTLIILATIESVKLLSASANEFLGLRGIGLEETIVLVEKICVEQHFLIRNYNFNYRKIVEAF